MSHSTPGLRTRHLPTLRREVAELVRQATDSATAEEQRAKLLVMIPDLACAIRAAAMNQGTPEAHSVAAVILRDLAYATAGLDLRARVPSGAADALSNQSDQHQYASEVLQAAYDRAEQRPE